MSIDRIHWHTLYTNSINENAIVIDAGANMGRFSQAMVSRFGCRCIAIEPSPNICKLIKPHKNMTIINCGLGDIDTTMDFYVSSKSVSSGFEKKTNAEYIDTCQVPVKTIRTIMEENSITSIDVLKMDIEGFEISVLESMSDEELTRIKQITIEFHDFSQNPQYPSAVATKAIERLRKLGFASIRMSRVGHQDVLLINQNLMKVSALELAYAQHVKFYSWGIKRVLFRKLGFVPKR